MNGDRDNLGKFAPGNSYGYKPGQSGNPTGRVPKSSLLKFMISVGMEEIDVKVPVVSRGIKKKFKTVRMTNAECLARKFWTYLNLTGVQIDVVGYKLMIEYLDGKPKEMDPLSLRSPEESAVLIHAALRKMDAADSGSEKPLDTEGGPDGSDSEVVAPAKASGRPRVSKKRKAVQRPARGPKKLQDGDGQAPGDPKGTDGK